MAMVSISEQTFNRIMRVVEKVERQPSRIGLHVPRPIIGGGGSSGVDFKVALVTGWDLTNYWNLVTIYDCQFHRTNDDWARTTPNWFNAIESSVPLRVIGVVERATRFAKNSVFLVFPAVWVDELPDGSDGPSTTYWTTWAASWQ